MFADRVKNEMAHRAKLVRTTTDAAGILVMTNPSRVSSQAEAARNAGWEAEPFIEYARDINNLRRASGVYSAAGSIIGSTVRFQIQRGSPENSQT